MTLKKSEESLLPSLQQSSTAISPHRSLYASNSALTKDGRYMIQEAEKHELSIALTIEKAEFAMSKAGELQVHAAHVFRDTCAGIDAVRQQSEGTDSQGYVNRFAHHQKDQTAGQVATIYDRTMNHVRAEVERSLPLTAPKEERKGFWERLLGG